MTDWERVRELVEEALDLPPAQRRQWVERAAAGNETLQREAMHLLDVPAPEHFLEPPQSGAAEALISERLATFDLEMRLGPYRVERLIATGGMGAVYEGRRADRQFEKRVAIKVLAATLATEEASRRFERERRLLASLEHPNIARLIDAGATPDGRPYLVMELVDGVSITSHAEGRTLAVAERLALFRDACEAVAFAHRALIVHRDIKPANILVSREGAVKLLDFGVAKLLDEADQADATVISAYPPLTPRYAAPEQLRGMPVTTACDVYSLGAVLYELLAGSDTRRGEARGQIEEAEPIPPSRLSAGLNRELDAIVLTAMATDPARRYRTVDELSQDVDRYLKGEPVRAHPPSRVYRARKALARHRWPAALAAAVLLFLVVFSAAAAWHAVRLEHERQRVEDARLRESAARRTADRIGAFLTTTLLAADPAVQGEAALSLLTLLEDAQSRLPELADDPAAEANLRLTLARVYAKLWLVNDARTHAYGAVDLYRRLAHPPPLADALQTLALIHQWDLDSGAAERAAEEALQIRRESGTQEEVADALSSLAGAVASGGRTSEARRHLGEALGIRRRRPDGPKLALAEDLEALAILTARVDDEQEAEALSDEALTARRASEQTPEVEARGLAARAEVFAALDRHDDAMALRERALALIEEARGRHHPSTVQPRLDLGYGALAQGRLAEAEAHFRDAAAIAMDALPPWHRLTSHARGRLGHLLLQREAYEEAEPHLLAAHESVVRMLGEQNMLATQLRDRVAQLYERWGKAPEAAKWSVPEPR